MRNNGSVYKLNNPGASSFEGKDRASFNSAAISDNLQNNEYMNLHSHPSPSPKSDHIPTADSQ